MHNFSWYIICSMLLMHYWCIIDILFVYYYGMLLVHYWYIIGILHDALLVHYWYIIGILLI